MANLIITIISIALIAVAALMGAYYGGTAFQQGQAKAVAVEISNNFRQTEAAVYAWMASIGTASPPDCSTDYPASCAGSVNFTAAEMASFLEPSFLSSGSLNASRVTIYRHPTVTNPYMVLFSHQFPKLTLEVCLQLEGLRTGTVPTSTRVYSTNVNDSACGKIGCFENNGAWGSVVTLPYIAYYRFAGKPMAAQADCN